MFSVCNTPPGAVHIRQSAVLYDLETERAARMLIDLCHTKSLP